MDFRPRLDADAAVPVFEQIRSQIAGAVADGRLAAGAQLPPARTLAADLGVAVGTVARAYRELAAAGLVTTRRRYGTLVAGAEHAHAPADVLAAAQRLAVRAGAAGLGTEQVVDLVRAAMAPNGPTA